MIDMENCQIDSKVVWFGGRSKDVVKFVIWIHFGGIIVTLYTYLMSFELLFKDLNSTNGAKL